MSIRPISLTFVAVVSLGVASGGNWPQFRGPGATGVAADGTPPTTWDAETGKNVRWKAAIAGLGHSCPVIWGDRVFITTAISGDAKAGLKAGLYGDVVSVEDDTSHIWKLLCLDLKTGKQIWEQTSFEGVPKIKRHTKATHANASPATDGKHVVAFFGSEGLYCYDMDGKLKWKKDLGVLDSGWYVDKGAQWEIAGSPVIHNGLVVLQCDVQENSFVAAYDLADGREVWKAARKDVPTWCTPTVHESGGRTQVIVNGYKHMGGYDLASGKELWRMAGGSDIPVPTPFVAHDLIFFSSSHSAPSALYAIKTDAAGDITLKGEETSGPHVAWSKPGRASYIPTPIVFGDELYVMSDNGALSVYDAKTVKTHYRQRIGKQVAFTGSAVAADGKVYFPGEDGETFVVKAGTKYELLATNKIGEVCLTTPAIVGDAILIRGERHLFCLGE